MGLSPSLGRDELVIDGETYSLFEQAGQRRWQTQEVATQPGDALAKPYVLSAHGGFGATNRHLGSDGRPTDPTHHDYGVNADATREAALMASQRITYLDLSTKAQRARGFRIGGYSNSVIGGAGSGVGAVGGGLPVDVPQQIIEYGGYLYALCGARTVVVSPDEATPSAVEGRHHGSSGRARSGDLFNNRLCVALGSNVDAEIATSPYTTISGTTWTTASGIQMSVFKRGAAGRLFSAQDHKVYNVLPGNNPGTAANYLPSAGEVITDQSDPVRSLTEYFGGLVSGTAKTARTIDPSRGFESVAILPESRLSSSEYDGRATFSLGSVYLHATSRGMYLVRPGADPLPVGPEELENNDSPYKNGEPGRPDFTGDYIAWPYYFPDTGDSVVFLARRRRQDEAGTGPYVWYDHLYLSGRECRTAYFWGGSATRGPRLFFGAGTTANPLQVGWTDWEEADAQPATSATLYWPMDDFGQPGVTLEVERLEMPNVENTDASNYLAWAVQPLGGSYINLVKAQTGSNQERVNSTGFQQVFAQNADVPSGKGLKFRLTITQAEAATSFAKVRGNPIAYIAARPETTREVTALLDVARQSIEDAEVIADRLRALVGEKVLLKHAPGDTDTYIRVTSAQVKEIEVRGEGGNKSDRRLAVQATWREVAVA